MTTTAAAILPSIPTISRRRWSLLAPAPEDVHWPDIAESLAKTGRFNGHTPGVLYSVAQHCCIVHDNLPLDARLAGLLHDAHEFAIGDIVTPLKEALTLLGARSALDRLTAASDRAIFTRAGLPYPLPPAIAAQVAAADMRAFATECRDVAPPGIVTDPAALPPPFRTVIRAWPWPKAAEEFLKRLYLLCPAR